MEVASVVFATIKGESLAMIEIKYSGDALWDRITNGATTSPTRYK